jgi:hypothetical protein
MHHGSRASVTSRTAVELADLYNYLESRDIRGGGRKRSPRAGELLEPVNDTRRIRRVAYPSAPL